MEILFQNSIGSISTDVTVVKEKYSNRKFSNETITKLSVKRKRNVVLAVLGFGMAAVLLILFLVGAMNGMAAIGIVFIPIGTLAFFIGMASWLGHHVILVESTTEIVKPIKIKMSKIPDGEQFYRELREVAFGEVNSEL